MPSRYISLAGTLLCAIAAAMLLASCGSASGGIAPSDSSSPSAGRRVTIDARDEGGQLLPGGVVNMWDDYQTTAHVVARCGDGELVTMLRRSGDGVLIENRAGIQGWVSYWFIKELK